MAIGIAAFVSNGYTGAGRYVAYAGVLALIVETIAVVAQMFYEAGLEKGRAE